MDQIAEKIGAGLSGKNFDGSLKFDCGEDGVIVLADGEASTDDQDTDCTIRISQDNLVKLLTGKLNPLTGVMNRRSFSVSLEEELNRMKRTRHAAAVILFDLDHFKRLNDEFGHHVGDEVLTGVASIAYSELRNPFDRLARWGGEEFIILLHDMSEETAKGVSERLRHRIAELVLEKSGEDVKVTASFGGSLLRPDQPFSEALHQADLALYEAKSNGRNRVEFRRCLQLAA